MMEESRSGTDDPAGGSILGVEDPAAINNLSRKVSDDSEESTGPVGGKTQVSGWRAMLSVALSKRADPPATPEPSHYQQQSRDNEKTPPSQYGNGNLAKTTTERAEPPTSPSTYSSKSSTFFHSLMANATDAWIMSQTSSTSAASSEHEHAAAKGRRKVSRPDAMDYSLNQDLMELNAKNEEDGQEETESFPAETEPIMDPTSKSEAMPPLMDLNEDDQTIQSIESMVDEDEESAGNAEQVDHAIEDLADDDGLGNSSIDSMDDLQKVPTAEKIAVLPRDLTTMRAQIYPTLSADSQDNNDVAVDCAPPPSKQDSLFVVGEKESPRVLSFQEKESSTSSREAMLSLEAVFIRDKTYIWIPARILVRAETHAIVAVDLPESWAETTVMEDEAHVKPNEIHHSMKDVPIEEQKRLVSKYKIPNSQLRKVFYNEYEDNMLPKQNQEDGKRDMADLEELHMAAILYNLKARHYRQTPYTRVGDIVIAMNPFCWIEGLYEPKARDLYSKNLIWDARHEEGDEVTVLSEKNMTYDKLGFEPHVYEVSALAYRGLATTGQDQTILVTGESGAGKTESSKIVLNHLATIQKTRPGGLPTEHSTAKEIVARVLQSSPVFEAFGNAKTVRNYNSSRFGKLIRLQFQIESKNSAESGLRNIPYANLVGSNCTTYLLEKNRVVSHDEGERTFHIFYQLLSAPSELKAKVWPVLCQRTTRDYAYTTGDIESNSHDVAAWEETISALEVFRFQGDSLRTLLRALVIVLQLGNLIFDHDRATDHATIRSESVLMELSELMGIEETELRATFVTRTLRTPGGQEEITVALSGQHAKESCDAFAKEIYAKVFSELVQKINRYTAFPESLLDACMTCGHISLLDIFGFERLGTNRFEQLCINYANERLHNKYVLDHFNEVKEEYESEGIDLYDFKLIDNSTILSLLEGNQGILASLDEECLRPKGNEEAFVYKIKVSQNESSRLINSKLHRKWEFGIDHFNGPVEYDAQNFVTRNTDKLPRNLIDCAAKSQNSLISDAFKSLQIEESKTSASKKSSVSGTVLQKFKNDLKSLLVAIEGTKTRYIRCIKPNAEMIPRLTSHNSTMQQLKCSGIKTALTISRESYPNKLPYDFVMQRYSCLMLESANDNSLITEKERVESMLNNCLKTSSLGSGGRPFVCGKTKVFFKAGARDTLEQLRQQHYVAAALKIQTFYRRIRCIRIARYLTACRVRIQSFGRMVVVRYRLNRQHTSATKLSCWWRCIRATIMLLQLREKKASRTIQAHTRGCAARKQYRRAIAAVCVIQRSVRQWRFCIRLLAAIQALNERARRDDAMASVIQARARGCASRRLFLKQLYAVYRIQRALRHWRNLSRLRLSLAYLNQLAQIQRQQKELAACKIQASTRGWHSRREFTEKKKEIQKVTLARSPIEGEMINQQNQEEDENDALSDFQEQLRGEISTLRAEKEELRSTLELTEKERRRFEGQAQHSGESAANYQTRIKRLVRTNDALVAEHRELELLRVEREELKTKLQSFESERKRLKEQNQKTNETLDTYQSRIRGLVKANESLVEELQAAQREAALTTRKLKKERDSFESKLAMAEKDLINSEVKFQAKVQELQKALQDSHAQNTEMQARWQEEITVRKEKRESQMKRAREELSAVQQKHLTKVIDVFESGQSQRLDEISRLTNELLALRKEKDEHISRLELEVKALQVSRYDGAKAMRAALEPRAIQRRLQNELQTRSERSSEFDLVLKSLNSLITETCVMPRYVSRVEMQRVIEQQERGQKMNRLLDALGYLFQKEEESRRQQSEAALSLIEEYIEITEPNRTALALKQRLAEASLEASRLREELREKGNCKRCSMRDLTSKRLHLK